MLYLFVASALLSASSISASVRDEDRGTCIATVNARESIQHPHRLSIDACVAWALNQAQVSEPVQVRYYGGYRIDASFTHEATAYGTACIVNYIGGPNPAPNAPWTDPWQNRTFSQLSGEERLLWRLETNFRNGHVTARMHGLAMNSIRALWLQTLGIQNAGGDLGCLNGGLQLLARGTIWTPSSLTTDRPSQWRWQTGPDDRADLGAYGALPTEAPFAPGYIPRGIVRVVQIRSVPVNGRRMSATIEADGILLNHLLHERGLSIPATWRP